MSSSDRLARMVARRVMRELPPDVMDAFALLQKAGRLEAALAEIALNDQLAHELGVMVRADLAATAAAMTGILRVPHHSYEHVTDRGSIDVRRIAAASSHLAPA